MKDEKLAVLIDADNVPYANVKEMLDEIAKYGTFSSPTSRNLKSILKNGTPKPI